MFLEDEDGDNSGFFAVEERRSSQAAADFRADFKGKSKAPMKAVADPEGQGSKDEPNIHDVNLMSKIGKCNVVHDFVQLLQKESAKLHTNCAARNVARANSLLEVNTLRSEKAAQRKRIVEVTGRLAKRTFSAGKDCRREGQHGGRRGCQVGAVGAGQKISVNETELKGEVVKGNRTVVGPKVKLEPAEKREEDVLYERYSREGRLQQSHRGHEKVVESITRVQGVIDRF